MKNTFSKIDKKEAIAPFFNMRIDFFGGSVYPFLKGYEGD